MAFTQDDLDAIDRALTGKELEVTYADRKVRYRSIAEIKEQRSIVSKAISSPRPRAFAAKVDRCL